MDGEQLLAATVAVVLTIFDLDRTFYLPSKVNKKAKLWFWYWAFYQDALMSDAEKRAMKEWLLTTINEAQSGDDFDQRATIADYLLSNRRGA